MARTGSRAEPRRLGGATRYNPRFVAGFPASRWAAGEPCAARRSLPASAMHAEFDVAIIGSAASGCRSPSPSPTAALKVMGVEKDPERLAALTAARGCRSRGAGAPEVLARVLARPGPYHRSDASRRGPRPRHRADPRNAGAHTSRWTCATSARPWTTSSACSARPLARPALDDRPGTTEFVAGYLPSTAASSPARTWRGPRPRADRGRPVPRGDRTLPCIVGGVGERSGESDEPVLGLRRTDAQTTPVQAELAKIWTNILRYTMFALPNRLMMECEMYGANVFEVIDLINRDYPRGGMARRLRPPARACARTSPSARSPPAEPRPASWERRIQHFRAGLVEARQMGAAPARFGFSS